MVLTVKFRLRHSVPDIDYVIFLSLHPLTVKSLFGCIIPFFTAILKRIKAWIVPIECINGGIFKLSVCCVTFQKKRQVTPPDRNCHYLEGCSHGITDFIQW